MTIKKPEGSITPRESHVEMSEKKLEKLRTGEYAGCWDLDDFMDERLKRLPSVVVPRPR